MICARHDWWDSAPCPKCDVPVTVAETPDEVENPELDIPDFLKRNPDGTFMHPAPKLGSDWTPTPPTFAAGEALAMELWPDLELYAALDGPDRTLVERQPIYQELRAREDKKKSLARIAEMKAKKAANAESK